jgi:phosphate transport system protein
VDGLVKKGAAYMKTRHHFHEKLEELKIDLLKMGGAVEESIARALHALMKKDRNLASDIIKTDEHINQQELDIEKTCVLLIATEQPVAGDLRFIISSLKAARDLERIGDYAAHMAKAAISLSDETLEIPHDIPRMTEHCLDMLKNTLQAYADENVDKADKVKKRDEMVDSLYLNVFRVLLIDMKEDPGHLQQVSSLLLVAKFLERLADHITNICEEIVYMCTGKRKDGAI